MNTRFIILLCFLLFSPLASAKINIGNTTSFETRHFVIDRDQHELNHSETFESTFYFEYKNDKNFKLIINPHIAIDAVNTDRNRYIPNEAFIEYYGNWGDIKTGLYVETWGTSPFYQPTNVLNRHDLEFSFYEAPAMGELILEYKKTFSEHISLKTYLLPLWQKTPLPELNTRNNLEGRANFVPYTLDDRSQNPSPFKKMGAGFDLQFTQNPFVMNFYYFHGPERTPGFVLKIDNQGALRLKPFYYDIDMLGATVETSLKEWIFKLELAGKLTLTNEAMIHSVPYEDGNALPKSYFQYVPSLEHTWSGLMGAANVTMMAAYYGDTEGASLRNFRPFQNDFFFGARADFNDIHQNQAEIGLLKDLSNSELAFFAKWQMRVYKELKLEVGGLILNRSNGFKTPISFFDNNSQVYSKISYSF